MAHRTVVPFANGASVGIRILRPLQILTSVLYRYRRHIEYDRHSRCGRMNCFELSQGPQMAVLATIQLIMGARNFPDRGSQSDKGWARLRRGRRRYPAESANDVEKHRRQEDAE